MSGEHRKDIRKLARTMERRGWSVVQQNSGHLKWTSPGQLVHELADPELPVRNKEDREGY